MAEVSNTPPEKTETYRNDVNDRITKRENISNHNSVRALNVSLTLAFCKPGCEIGGCLEILVHMSTEHAIPPPR